MQPTRTRELARLVAVGLIASLFLGFSARAGRAEVTEKHRKAVNAVVGRLLANVSRPEGYDAWPPKVLLLDQKAPNAYATIDVDEYRKSEKKVPVMGVTTSIVEALEFNEDRLALVLGHELGHLVLNHVLNNLGETEITKLAFGREDELAADQFGMQLALKAGYSYAKLLQAFTKLRDLGDYTSFEELHVGHPNWANRLAELQKDDAKRTFWQSMSAFESGVFFLLTEQYENAERCFDQVTRDFPGCYEAWANLGYARLMMYCDGLEEKDLKNFDVGHLVVGGFYRRADSLVRGIDEKLWFDAVGALREAIRLKPELILPKANLAVAYLVRPAGKDVGEAARLFDEIAEALKDEKAAEELDPLVRAALMINMGVGEMSAGRAGGAKKIFEQVAATMLSESPRARGGEIALRRALDYNQALALAASPDATSRQTALDTFERYLANTPAEVAWWPIAYERYKDVASKLGVEPKPADELQSKSAAAWRMITSVQLTDETQVALSAPLAEVTKSLGEPEASVPVLGNLRRVSYTKHGVKLLTTRRVIAIVLDDPNGPTLQLRRSGLGAQPIELRVGMTREEFEKIAGGDKPIGYIVDHDYQSGYRFYTEIGLAVKFRKGVVAELVVAPLPRKRA